MTAILSCLRSLLAIAFIAVCVISQASAANFLELAIVIEAAI